MNELEEGSFVHLARGLQVLKQEVHANGKTQNCRTKNVLVQKRTLEKRQALIYKLMI